MTASKMKKKDLMAFINQITINHHQITINHHQTAKPS